ncbi:hypothetical protein GJ699_12540 [Duganella sp. FT80W]|uniref:Lipoprotein n=1 Tax=Duganella guangzhouensis TaxID=2666084 RepID=A0A6I2L3J9_9BURK|nr:hypothetical protein [Duganella guangzhouensis]MRW90819.1 hypothetical protein [Duganella guangzhouensis]
MRRKAIALVLVSIAIAGCAQQHRYQRFDIFRGGGYHETKIGYDIYEVTYEGGHSVSTTTLGALVTYRCAELSLSNGYKYFEVQKGTLKLPGSYATGFASVTKTIRMYKAEPEKHSIEFYSAAKVISDYRESIEAAR